MNPEYLNVVSDDDLSRGLKKAEMFSSSFELVSCGSAKRVRSGRDWVHWMVESIYGDDHELQYREHSS